MEKFGMGQPVRREEDPRLLKGNGTFINDRNLPGQAYAFILRSPHAHAEIRKLDTSAAAAAPGVLGIFTGEDVQADGLGTPGFPPPVRKRKKPNGDDAFLPPHPGLAVGRVRYVGDPIAMIVADTLDQAKDAAELIDIDVNPLPSVTDSQMITAPGAPAVYDECPDNISHEMSWGDADGAQAAFDKAAHVVTRKFVISRVHAQFMETRGVLGDYDEKTGRYTLYADVQYPHRVREVLATKILNVPDQDIRVVAGDVGGGFGAKGWQYAEHRLSIWAAKKIGRPVKWSCDRSEAVMADEHGRDNVTEVQIALDAGGKFLGLKVDTLCNLGAYISAIRNLLSSFTNIGTTVGVYDFPVAHVHMVAALSNSNPVAPYRGAGRPEATYVIERLIDEAASEIGMDPAELRAKNLITPDQMPYQNPLDCRYDSGDFPTGQAKVLEMADWAGFEARRAESASRGMLRGIGLANGIERAASPGMDFAEVRFSTAGKATILMGTKAQGQGHETMYKQIAGEFLGLDPENVRVIDGDTDQVAFGMGTMGSRSTVIGGTALYNACSKVAEKGQKIAAHVLEAAEQDIEFKEGQFSVTGTDLSMSITDVAKAAFNPATIPAGMEPGLFETGTFSPEQDTYPNGSHVCEVEIDPGTGEVKILDYNVVDDVGNVVNPICLKGQIHGGIAQGVGQILMEQVAYDPGSGQLLSGSFMDYAMPRADNFSDIKIVSNPVPTQLNPLGVKGAGEAGTVGAMPSLMNAIMDALRPAGVEHLDMPATPARVWAAIEAAKAKQAA